MPRLRLASLVALLLAVALPVASLAQVPEPPAHDRLYLLGAETDYLYWGVDAEDPELDVRLALRRCGAGEPGAIPGRSKPCLQTSSLGGQRTYAMFFFPASSFEESVSWGADAPLRFRLELDVSSTHPYTVHLLVQRDTRLDESPPATEVEPGIFEGVHAVPSSFETDTVNILGVMVRTEAPRITMELNMRGASYVELAEPARGRAVPRLLAEDTHRPDPTSFATPARSLSFNDDLWSSWSFEGDTSESRAYQLALEEDAEALIAWVELWHSPLVYDVLRGRPVKTDKLTDGASIAVVRDGADVARSPGPFLTEGAPSVAATGVEAGPLTIEVDPAWQDGDHPYTVHLVATHGERTLAAMRWLLAGDGYLRTPVVSGCAPEREPVPVTGEVTTFLVDLDWDTEALGDPGWTLSFDLPGVGWFPCSEAGTGDWIRFTMPGPDVWYFGATPAYDRTMVTLPDTVFEFKVRYAYTPPPPPEEEEPA